MFAIERYHDICAGHRVVGHESKCAHLHGHNYRFHFTCVPGVQPPAQRKFFGQKSEPNPDARDKRGLDNLGRVVDFSVVKATLCQWLEDKWDHKFLVWEHDPNLMDLTAIDPVGVVMVPFNPTAENMAQYLVEVVAPKLLDPEGVVLLSCRIEETRKCSAIYTL